MMSRPCFILKIVSRLILRLSSWRRIFFLSLSLTRKYERAYSMSLSAIFPFRIELLEFRAFLRLWIQRFRRIEWNLVKCDGVEWLHHWYSRLDSYFQNFISLPASRLSLDRIDHRRVKNFTSRRDDCVHSEFLNSQILQYVSLLLLFYWNIHLPSLSACGTVRIFSAFIHHVFFRRVWISSAIIEVSTWDRNFDKFSLGSCNFQ